jgi:hypothetical protein
MLENTNSEYEQVLTTHITASSPHLPQPIARYNQMAEQSVLVTSSAGGQSKVYITERCGRRRSCHKKKLIETR